MSRLPVLRYVAALALLLAPAAAFAQASASPYTSATRYDLAGRVTGTIAADPDGAGSLHHLAVRNSYDAAGRVIRVETGELATWQSEAVAPASWSGFTISRTLETSYDAMGRKIRDTLREGADGTTRTLTQYGYDGMGRLTCTAVRMNETQFGGSLPDACTQAGGTIADRITRNVYDVHGQRVQLRGGVGTNDEGTEATWDYTPNGLVAAVIDGNGNRAQLTYDGLDRQTRWTFPSATRPTAFNDFTPATALATAGSVNAADYEEYGYDPNGNRTNLRKRDGSVLGYIYDALNRLTVKTVPERTTGSQALTAAQTRDVYYGYDLRGLQLSARFDSQSGEGVTNAYDGFGRLTSSSTNMGGTTRTLTYAWDANGNRTRITHPGVGAPLFDYRYDGLNRMYGLLENGATWIAALAYDNAGDRAALGRGGTGVIYTHDPIGRLTGLNQAIVAPAAVAWTFGHNPASQIESTARDNDAYAWTRHYAVNRGYTTNGLNQYTAAGGAGFGYDANGSLTSDSDNAYVYDVENRLVGVSPLTQYGHSAALVYDPLGRLWQVTNTATGAVTQFLYDGDALVAEYEASGAVTARYVHGPGVDEPWFWYDGDSVSSTSRRQLGADWQGSIAAVTDAVGYSLAINTYDEHGIPGTGNLAQERFQYTGQAWLPELGMYYYKARIYSPTLGRFMQTDPIGYDGGINLYGYVGDDPLNKTDPPGTQAIPIPRLPLFIPVPGMLPPGIRPPSPEQVHRDLQNGGAVLGCVMSPLQCALTAGRVLLNQNGAPPRTGAQDADGRVVTDQTGKVHGDLPAADDVPDDAVEDSIDSLDHSIGVREQAIRDHPPGDPNGSSRERREARQRENHQERVRRETELRDRLKERS